MKINVIGSTDKVSIDNWYNSQTYRIKEIQTADNKILSHSYVDSLVSAMAAFTIAITEQNTIPADR